MILKKGIAFTLSPRFFFFLTTIWELKEFFTQKTDNEIQEDHEKQFEETKIKEKVDRRMNSSVNMQMVVFTKY